MDEKSTFNNSFMFNLLGVKIMSQLKKRDVVQRPITDCSFSDSTAPVLLRPLLSIADDGSTTSSPTISFEAATDNCKRFSL